jgi:hypothetical protein
VPMFVFSNCHYPWHFKQSIRDSKEGFGVAKYCCVTY